MWRISHCKNHNMEYYEIKSYEKTIAGVEKLIRFKLYYGCKSCGEKMLVKEQRTSLMK